MVPPVNLLRLFLSKEINLFLSFTYRPLNNFYSFSLPFQSFIIQFRSRISRDDSKENKGESKGPHRHVNVASKQKTQRNLDLTILPEPPLPDGTQPRNLPRTQKGWTEVEVPVVRLFR